MSRNAEFKQTKCPERADRVRRACDDAPPSVPVRLCDAPYYLLARETWFAPNVPLAPVPAPHASRPLPSAGNWVCFSCSIPPLFVLSHSMPMINTTGKLALFGAFLSPLAPSLWIHWPLFFRPTPAPAPPAGSGRAQTLPFPAGYCLTPTAEFIGKDRTESNLDERSLYFIMSPNRAIPAEKSNRFSPLAAAQPLTIRSRDRRGSTPVAPGVPAGWP